MFLNYMDVHGFREPFRSRRLTPRQYRELIGEYDNSLRSLDREIGRLVDGLARVGIADHTLLILTSDHGDLFGDDGYVGHGWGVFLQLVQVPLLIRFPHAAERRRVNATVSGVDVLPTVLAAAGLPPDPLLDGRSLIVPPALERPVIAEAYGQDWVQSSRKYEVAAFLGDRKYLLNADRTISVYVSDDAARGGTGAHIERAANEEVPATVVSLLSSLSLPSNEGTATPVDRDVKSRLRSLGYVNSGTGR